MYASLHCLLMYVSRTIYNKFDIKQQRRHKVYFVFNQIVPANFDDIQKR